MKNLESYGVQEMNAKEMKNVDGGAYPWIRVIAKLMAAGVAFDEWYKESGYIEEDMGIPFCA